MISSLTFSSKAYKEANLAIWSREPRHSPFKAIDLWLFEAYKARCRQTLFCVKSGRVYSIQFFFSGMDNPLLLILRRFYLTIFSSIRTVVLNENLRDETWAFSNLEYNTHFFEFYWAKYGPLPAKEGINQTKIKCCFRFLPQLLLLKSEQAGRHSTETENHAWHIYMVAKCLKQGSSINSKDSYFFRNQKFFVVRLLRVKVFKLPFNKEMLFVIRLLHVIVFRLLFCKHHKWCNRRSNYYNCPSGIKRWGVRAKPVRH